MPNDSLTTPPGIYAALDREFRFTHDAACSPENALATPIAADALSEAAWPWPLGPVFCNPPYSAPSPWIERSVAASSEWGSVVVLLLQADTSTSWFADLQPLAELRFIRNRLRFGGTNGRARFASLVAILGRGEPGSARIWAPDAEMRGLRG